MADPVTADKRALERMIFFGDAVFAFALTLLALEVRLPAGIEEGRFWAEAAALAPQLGAFLISFALAAMWWLVHMAVTRELRAFDWPTAICNLLFLVFIVLLPFAAATFGSNILSNDALGLYWCVNAGAAFALTLLFIVMSRDGGRLLGGVSKGRRWLHIVQAAAPGVVFVLGAYWAFTDATWLARLCGILIAPAMLLLGLIEARLARREASPPPPAP
ncbi:MAG TPA: TMEM175 family protein [Terricaulis sp.]|nr:TMEM175 family protein [Terricaulis sp.]